VPLIRPESPRFANGAEKRVWESLRDRLDPADALIANFRFTDERKDHEADAIVLLPGYGAAVVEVKGGRVWAADGGWRQASGNGPGRTIHPVEQARACRYGLRTYIERDARWRAAGHSRFRWTHHVVVPYTTLDHDFAVPDCPRWMIHDRGDLPDLVERLRAALRRQDTSNRPLDHDDVGLVLEILAGRGQAQRDIVAESDEREDEAQRLTEAQAMILDATRVLPRVEVRGGAGSGKTWMAVEQARRLSRAGRRVALLCYSRGLAAYLRRHVETFDRRQRPAYVGEFHALGRSWGAAPGSDDDSDYWEHRLPAEMVSLASALPDGKRFDAIVIDEAQDFADEWWPAVLAALKDEETGGIYVYSDEGQRVFARFGQPPVPLVPLMLDQNLRNTKQIATAFGSLAPIRMKLFGGDGPAVRFIECATVDAVEVADDQIDALLGEGWRVEDIALLTTGSRHDEQVSRQELLGQEGYWDTFWDDEQVFYGHVLGFKGLERRCVVLVLNESTVGERSTERLYVGLSRARDQLIVVGDPEFVRTVGGDEVLRRLRG
jgi:hypothetical protein